MDRNKGIHGLGSRLIQNNITLYDREIHAHLFFHNGCLAPTLPQRVRSNLRSKC